jgi:hypothetical protein
LRDSYFNGPWPQISGYKKIGKRQSNSPCGPGRGPDHVVEIAKPPESTAKQQQLCVAR